MDQQSSVSHVPPASQSAGDSPKPVKKRRHRWVWVVVLLFFAATFYWVIQHQQKGQAATAGGGRRPMGGTVPVTIATARKGSVGVYENAIGTVTPIYTASMTAQVTGVITEVHYREGQTVSKGDPLIDIDSRQYEALLAQAQGTLDRDQNVLAQAEMDLERYKVAWAKNAISRQLLEDQEKLVLQQKGTVKNDEGAVEYDAGAGGLLPHQVADQRPGGPAAGRSRQPGHRQFHNHSCGGHRGTAHHGDLHPG